ncbi:MAG: undecaprenyl/decaprenyl-phosphate alpha-N-acetylglucosaminyl 1-phosphate transferase [Acidobacteriota bacterium]|nr:undecaprenyl/decaprenyl-phosphate alpha-N-acetylglucosaminyl 1-phosphate transferase [Acidobacteriota bacterium]
MALVGIVTAISAMVITWLVTPVVIRFADWIGAVDVPGARKIHSTPIPRIGGVAVFAGFVGAVVVAAAVTDSWPTSQVAAIDWRGLAVAAFGLLLVGLLDDLRGLSFQWKFAAQILAASYVWTCGFSVESLALPGVGNVELGAMSYFVTVFWVVAVTNAVNLIDGLDGLAAGSALITCVAMAMIAFGQGKLGVTAASVALAGALLGFLRYNFNPARIFLGDSGSLFLGFVLAVISVRGSQKASAAVAVLVPLLVLGLPLLDTGLAVSRRLYRLSLRGIHEPGSTMRYVVRNVHHVFLPDRGHIHHVLVDSGLSHRWAVLALYGLGAGFAGIALAMVSVRAIWFAVGLSGLLFVSLSAMIYVLYRRGRWWAKDALPSMSATGAGPNEETTTDGEESNADGVAREAS